MIFLFILRGDGIMNPTSYLKTDQVLWDGYCIFWCFSGIKPMGSLSSESSLLHENILIFSSNCFLPDPVVVRAGTSTLD